ncbi:hypothetical protein OO013_13670 [Mangrovivirga sp. M17]|uniref:Lipoprotein n=1 Tax=Mangrovivirga halotolerans TaxID=2993936 RepID=A0ABT3RT09_9BACT|nr:hypothetical protein [Mangrovivirga halotolerans]MCX2744926.1 hypothetical protein [Mangrovivirga halotolerans]
MIKVLSLFVITLLIIGCQFSHDEIERNRTNIKIDSVLNDIKNEINYDLKFYSYVKNDTFNLEIESYEDTTKNFYHFTNPNLQKLLNDRIVKLINDIYQLDKPLKVGYSFEGLSKNNNTAYVLGFENQNQILNSFNDCPKYDDVINIIFDGFYEYEEFYYKNILIILATNDFEGIDIPKMTFYDYLKKISCNTDDRNLQKSLEGLFVLTFADIEKDDPHIKHHYWETISAIYLKLYNSDLKIRYKDLLERN